MHSREKWVILERRTEKTKDRKPCIFGAVEKPMRTGGSWVDCEILDWILAMV